MRCEQSALNDRPKTRYSSTNDSPGTCCLLAIYGKERLRTLCSRATVQNALLANELLPNDSPERAVSLARRAERPELL